MPLNIQDLSITSPQFGFGHRIADQHAAVGGNKIPELQISGVPNDAVELAVIVHDPDAPLPNGFTHWVVYGVDPGTTSLPATNPGGSYREGPNSLGENAYVGPAPPQDHGTHHYYFWVYALNRPVQGEPVREEFLSSYADAVVEQNRHVGTFST